MTRTAMAIQGGSYPNNIIDFSAYQREKAMEIRRYVLVPVEEVDDQPSQPAPRPRRNHHNAARATFIHTCLNLTLIAVTLSFTVALLGVL